MACLGSPGSGLLQTADKLARAPVTQRLTGRENPHPCSLMGPGAWKPPGPLPRAAQVKATDHRESEKET